MMEILKKKYHTVMEQKSEQAKELIESEEEKLTIAKALVELKLEHSALREKSEKEHFELTSQLLTAKKQIVELDSKALLAQSESVGHRESLSEVEILFQKEKDEACTLRATLAEVRDTLSKERTRNLELGAELLTLVNQRELIGRMHAEAQQKLDQSAEKIEANEEMFRDHQHTMEELKAELIGKENDILEFKRKCHEAELEVKEIQMEMGQLQAEKDRQAAEYHREKDSFHIKARQAADAEIKKAQKDFEEAQLTIRRAERSARDRDREILRLEEDLQKTRKELKEVEMEEESVRAAFRSKMVSLMASSQAEDINSSMYSDGFNAMQPPLSASGVTRTVDVTGTVAAPDGNRNSIINVSGGSATGVSTSIGADPMTPEGSSAAAVIPAMSRTSFSSSLRNSRISMRRAVVGLEPIDPNSITGYSPRKLEPGNSGDAALDDLLSSYIEKEKFLIGGIEALNTECAGFKKAYRMLYNKYRQVLDILEENAPTAMVQESDIVEEKELISKAQVGVESTGDVRVGALSVGGTQDEITQEKDKERWRELFSEQEQMAAALGTAY